MAKNALTVKASTPAREAAPFPNISIRLDLHPTAHANGVTALEQAQGIEIRDKASHESARTLAKAWKAEKREVEAWYRDKMVTPLKKALDWARDQMNTDLALFEQAITTEDALDTAYVREQQRLEQDAADARRKQAEAEEQAKRDKEAAEAEAAAVKLEQSSNILSAREQVFVSLVVTSNKSMPAMINAAKKAGYKDAEASLARLMKSEKINTAIANAEKAAAIRRESDAKQAAPVIVDVAPVESQIGTVSGTSMRTYYGCGKVEMQALLKAVLDGRVPFEAIQANMVFLNAQARSLKEHFPKVYPGCQLTKREGIAG